MNNNITKNSVLTTYKKIQNGRDLGNKSAVQISIQILLSHIIFTLGVLFLVDNVPFAIFLLYLFSYAMQIIYKDFINFHYYIAYLIGKGEVDVK